MKKKIISSNALFDEFAENNNLSVITIESIFNKVRELKSILLAQEIRKFIKFVSFTKGTVFVNTVEDAPRNIINRMNLFFEDNNIDINVALSHEEGQPTLEQQEKILLEKQIQEISKQPIMKEFFKRFTNYSVEKIEKL